MVYVDPSSRLERINQHSEQVSLYYRKALTNVELYPASMRNDITEKLSSEYNKFLSAVEMVTEGSYKREITARLGTEARSWLAGAIPLSIRRYAYSQVSKEDLANRLLLAQERITHCNAQEKVALEVIEVLTNHDGKSRKKDRAAVKSEARSFRQAFTLYGRGVPWREIQELTGQPIQSRVEALSLPSIITKYAGYPLSEGAQRVRHQKSEDRIQKLEQAAEQAKEKLKADNHPQLEDKLALIDQTLADFKLVVNLYRRGLGVEEIRTLTGLAANQWISKATLPAPIARTNLDRHHRDFTLPQHIDPFFSYIVGAMFADTRVFSTQRGIIFRNRDETKLKQLKGMFESVFKTTLVDPKIESKEAKTFVLRVTSELLTGGIFGILKIGERESDPLLSFDILKDRDLRRGFIKGYIDFCRPYIEPQRHRFGVSRTHQHRVITALATALYLEKIYPGIHNKGDSAALTITNNDDFQKLGQLAPSIVGNKILKVGSSQTRTLREEIGDYDNYQVITRLLKLYYPTPTRLNFKHLLRASGFTISNSEKVPNEVKSRIRSWRHGVKPVPVQRVDALRAAISKVYPLGETT